jgi:hypothetical protein
MGEVAVPANGTPDTGPESLPAIRISTGRETRGSVPQLHFPNRATNLDARALSIARVYVVFVARLALRAVPKPEHVIGSPVTLALGVIPLSPLSPEIPQILLGGEDHALIGVEHGRARRFGLDGTPRERDCVLFVGR